MTNMGENGERDLPYLSVLVEETPTLVKLITNTNFLNSTMNIEFIHKASKHPKSYLYYPWICIYNNCL